MIGLAVLVNEEKEEAELWMVPGGRTMLDWANMVLPEAHYLFSLHGRSV